MAQPYAVSYIHTARISSNYCPCKPCIPCTAIQMWMQQYYVLACVYSKGVHYTTSLLNSLPVRGETTRPTALPLPSHSVGISTQGSWEGPCAALLVVAEDQTLDPGVSGERVSPCLLYTSDAADE